MTDADLHDLAVAAGAMVLGEPGTQQQYMLDLSQIARLVELVREHAALPPCPVPLPNKNADSET